MELNNKSMKPLKWYRNLDSLNNRMADGVFLIEGERAVRQIFEHHPGEIIEILASDKHAGDFSSYPVRILNEKQLSSISSVQTPQGIIAVVRLPENIYTDILPENPGNRILLFEHIQDPGNAGTLIRTAAAFGFNGIIMSQKCADPFSAKTIQSTAGSILSLWLRRSENYLDIVSRLQENQYSLAAADLNGNLTPSRLSRINKSILALGNEASGLSRQLLEMADMRIKIPLDREKAESLNVAVSGAILMYSSKD